MLIMEANKRKSLVEEINNILCKYDPIKGEVELYRLVSQVVNIVFPPLSKGCRIYC